MPAALARQEYHFALVVGINKYPALTPLRGPRRDADEMYAWLTSPDGGHLPPGNVERVEVDDAAFDTPESAEPTRRQINDAPARR